MSLNSIEVRPAPSSFRPPVHSTHEALTRLTGEQLRLAMTAAKDVKALQDKLDELARSFVGEAFRRLGGQDLPSLDQIAVAEGLEACFSNARRIRAAAEALERETFHQWKMLIAFSKLFDGMGVRHD